MNELFIMLMSLFFGIAIIMIAYGLGKVDGEAAAKKRYGSTMDTR